MLVLHYVITSLIMFTCHVFTELVPQKISRATKKRHLYFIVLTDGKWRLCYHQSISQPYQVIPALTCCLPAPPISVPIELHENSVSVSVKCY